MYELKTNTAVRIAVGPLVDPTDGKTAETALTVTGLSCEIFQIKTDGSAVVRTAFSPTASGGNNDMVHVTDDTTGMYDLELTAAQLNWLGNGRIAFYDVDGFLVHWIDIHVVSANYFDWKYGTGNVNSDVIAISGDTTAADNCELMFDGTGYAGGTTKLDVNTATIANGAITAAAIATGAIDADAIADNAIDAGAIATGAITSAKFAAGAIDAAAIADAAIDAATFAADVDAEIATMVWNALTNAYGGAGTYGQAVEDILTDTGTTLDGKLDTITAETSSHPTLAEIEASAALAKEATVAALNNLSSADVEAAVDAALDNAMPASPTSQSVNAYLRLLINALVNKLVITESDGATELFDDAGSSLGSVAAAFTSAAGVTTRKRMVP